MAHRAAIIGCGLIGSEFADTVQVPGIWSHAAAYAGNADTELVAICDSDAARLASCSARWRVAQTYNDYAQLLAHAQPEIVSVCVPDMLHYAVIAAALRQSSVRAVFAEKPLATELSQARELVAIAAERQVILAVNYSRRYAPGFVTLKKTIGSGAIGSVQAISGYYTKGTAHNGSHWFDLADYLFGPVSAVSASDRMHEPGSDPTLDVDLQLKSGVSGHLLGCDSNCYALFEMDIVASAGRARIVDSGFTIQLQRLAASVFGAGYRSLGTESVLEGGLGQALPEAVADIVNCLRDDAAPRCSGADAVRALAVAIAARQSVQSGQPVACAIP
jgi:predicted dehydrogenase